jgi:hypothetical protein
MTIEEKIRWRAEAETHKATRRSAKIIIRCLDEIELLTNEKERLRLAADNAIDAALARFPKCAFALKRLKTIAGI